MCTAITYKTRDFYFGRNLDYDYSYNEEIIITPRNYQFKFKKMPAIKNHYAIIGMACCLDDYPLYYDGCNEKGLCIAGLNFVNNAYYFKSKNDKNNISVFEFIPYILATCASIKEVKKALENINIVDIPFKKELPSAKLHYLIADKHQCITVEQVKEGLKVYDNPVGVLTNNPPFDMQLFSLNNYLNLSSKEPNTKFSSNLVLNKYSRGMGALGLPGDLSSQSRFVRASFVKQNSISKNDEISSVNQFFHILHSVEQQRGCCELENKKYEITIYSSCINASKGIYYYTTYNNHQINAVKLHNEDLNSDKLIKYVLSNNEVVNYQNQNGK